jgi:hypothetical protein
MAGAQDCCSGGFEFGSDMQEIEESSEGEAIVPEMRSRLNIGLVHEDVAEY